MSYRFRSAGRSRYQRKPTHNRRSNRGGGQYIDPSRFIKVAQASESEEYAPKHTFADFDLHHVLQTNLEKHGYETPSPIQDQAIPEALAGRDVIGIASTGTGKTAAFALPILHKLISEPGSAALIIAPTRELALQIEEECKKIAKGSGLFGTVLIGGTGMGQQLRDLRQNPRIVIGTPGRIKDHLQRGTLKLKHTDMIVLDEVDRMLDMGFVHDVTEILSQTNQDRQAYFFSATMDTRVKNLVHNYTQDPVIISIKASATSENVHQDVVRYQSTTEKIDKLHNILIEETVSKVIVFDETKRSVERLSKELIARGFEADALHGGKSQGQRKKALTRFKDNHVSILVATDVAARGLDVSDISHVINYSVPKVYDDYIHRVGRAGRAGKIGYALTFVTH